MDGNISDLDSFDQFALISPILHICHLKKKSKIIDFGCYNFGFIVEFLNYTVHKLYTQNSDTEIKGNKSD